MKFFNGAKQKLTDTKKRGFSLEFRFLGTFIALLVTVLLAAWIMMTAMGTFRLDKSNTTALMEHELANLSEQMKKDFNAVSSHSINLSETLAFELNRQLNELDISPEEIADHPELLNALLESVYPTLAAELKALKASGVFFILDATVNPSLEGAEHSRSGIFIKNISAQNNLFTTHYDLRYLYGPMQIAQRREMAVLPQWKLEFDVQDMSFFNEPMRVAKEHPNANLSQLFYWSGKVSDGGSDYGTYCSVPIILNDTVIGVCGYEIGVMQFRLGYAPDIQGQVYSFCMLTPTDGDSLFFERAMFSGNYVVAEDQPSKTIKAPQGSGFLEYDCGNGHIFFGKQTNIPLYSNSSHFSSEGFAAVILTPKEQLTEVTRSTQLRFISVIVLLFVVGVVLSVVLCRHNIKPIKQALTDVRKNKSMANTKTRIREIDDLFDFLEEKDREQDEQLRRLTSEKEEALRIGEQARSQAESLHMGPDYDVNEIDPELYEAFVRNLSDLTEREKDIFDLYIQGKKAKEIQDLLQIKENTMKFHNRNIYDKLCVSSRKQLVLYAKHMQAQSAKEQ